MSILRIDFLKTNFGQTAEQIAGNLDEFMATMQPISGWPHDGFTKDARVYGLRYEQDDPLGTGMISRIVEHFHRTQSIPLAAPVALFGPFQGSMFLIGQVNVLTPVDLRKALGYINMTRARHAQRPLDPVVSGWTDDDIVIEAKRLGWRPQP